VMHRRQEDQWRLEGRGSRQHDSSAIGVVGQRLAQRRVEG
jgi:hypothetical protein